MYESKHDDAAPAKPERAAEHPATHAELSAAATRGELTDPTDIIALGLHCASACPSPQELMPFIRAATAYMANAGAIVRTIPEPTVPDDWKPAAEFGAEQKDAFIEPPLIPPQEDPPKPPRDPNTHDANGDPIGHEGVDPAPAL